MVKKDQTDYAAAYRQFCNYGRGRSLKKFCEEENFNYSKLRKYIDKAFWTASKFDRSSIGCQCAPLELEKSSDSALDAEKPLSAMEKADSCFSIASIEIKLTNGLHLKVESPSVDSFMEVLQKLVG